MKEYKMIETSKWRAEETMNAMARQGWRVVSVTYWNVWTIKLLITFERDI